MRQTAALVGMLQETHSSLIASNERLLAELAETKERHASEVLAFQRNFDEVSAELRRARERSPAERPPAEKGLAERPAAEKVATAEKAGAKAHGMRRVGGGGIVKSGTKSNKEN